MEPKSCRHEVKLYPNGDKRFTRRTNARIRPLNLNEQKAQSQMKIQEEQAMKLNTICDKLIDKVLSELKVKIY